MLASNLAINPIIYAEISARFSSPGESRSKGWPIWRWTSLSIPRPAAFLAGKAFATISPSGRNERQCPADFFIGAHAAVLGLPAADQGHATLRCLFSRRPLDCPVSSAPRSAKVKGSPLARNPLFSQGSSATPGAQTKPPCLTTCPKPTTPPPLKTTGPNTGSARTSSPSPRPTEPEPKRPAGQPLYHPAAAAQRHRPPAHGPHAQPDGDGHSHPLAAHERPPRAVAARHRPRRHRHADDGGAPAGQPKAQRASSWAAKPSSSASGSGSATTAAPSSTR